jgi:P27 family predicted phage terminase small subunit
MGHRGPKGDTKKEAQSALEALPTVLPERRPPPETLNDAGKERWRELVGELPVNRLRVSDFQMLEAMIRAEQYVENCDQNIAKHGLVIGPTPKTNPAVRIREYNLRTIVQIQRALRLCPSTRLRQDSPQLPATSPASKPWETTS